MLLNLFINCFVKRNTAKQFFGSSLAMVQFVIAAQLCFEQIRFCPAFINGKTCHFCQPADVFLINNHTEIDWEIVFQACINSFNNFFECLSSTFQETPLIVHGANTIKCNLYFTDVCRRKDVNVISQ